MQRGKKFVDRYGVQTSQGYQCDPDHPALVIPPPGHALYDADENTVFDERTVAEIDRDGVFVGDVVVWTDVDRSLLYVVDGRGNLLNLREVNRRRRERGDTKMVTIHIKPLDVTLDRAVEHVRLRNFHRKRITLGHVAREVVALSHLGKSPSRIAEVLRLGPGESTEEWQRSVAPLAHAVPEVVAAAEEGMVKRKDFRRFGGKKIDGSERLPRDEQLALLAELTAARATLVKTGPSPVSLAARRRIVAALKNGAVEKIRDPGDRVAAEVARRVLEWEAGDKKALAEWPELAAVFKEAVSCTT